MKRITLIFLAVVSIIAGSISCQKVNDIDKRLAELEKTVSDLKTQIAAGAVITSVDKTEDGYTFTLSNGQTYKVTNGKDGSDGEAIIADVKIEEDFVVLVLKNGETLRISYQNPLSMVTLNIIPDFSDGSVYSYSNNGSFFLRVSVTPEKYIEKLSGNDGLICKADFRSVITKATLENSDFTVVGEIASASVEEGYLTASFTLNEDEMKKIWDADHVVSFSIKDNDGVHGASTSFVPVSWYRRDGEGGGKVLEIEGHKVTVKVSGDVTPHDVLIEAYAEGNTAKILAFAMSEKKLVCEVDGTAEVSRDMSGRTCAFTISNIGSDVTATIGYEMPITVTALSNNPAWGKVAFEGKPFKGETITFTATAYKGFCFVRWLDANGNTLSSKNPYSVTLDSELVVTAVFAVDNAPGGIFTVNAISKKVRFSKGNLWADSSNVLHFEDNQWSIPSITSIDDNHVTHFTWSDNVADAVGISNRGSYIFCNESHKQSIEGSSAVYYVLSKDEWTYLLDTHRKKWATVNGVNGYVIAPDGYSGSLSGSYTAEQFAATDFVFLPAASYRDGAFFKDYVGVLGLYWSSTPAITGDDAYGLTLSDKETAFGHSHYRNVSCSIRLVMDYNN